jgi:formate/nitrite transporter FocA (FNT family)
MGESEAVRILEAERTRIALLTRRGIGMPMAGFFYWIAMALFVRLLPERTALVYGFFATGAVFPLGILFTRLAGGDLFVKSAVFTNLGLQLAFLQIFFWPVIIIVFGTARPWTPYVMVVLFCSHFLPYNWLYRSRAYAFLAVGTAAITTLVAIAVRNSLFLWAPLIAAGCYAVAVGMLVQENRADLTRSKAVEDSRS